MNKTAILNLIAKLDTQSPKKRLAALQEFFLDTPEINEEERGVILESYRERATAMSERGKEYSRRMQPMKLPQFSRNFAGEGVCSGCGELMETSKLHRGPAFFRRNVDNWERWHIT